MNLRIPMSILVVVCFALCVACTNPVVTPAVKPTSAEIENMYTDFVTAYAANVATTDYTTWKSGAHIGAKTFTSGGITIECLSYTSNDIRNEKTIVTNFIVGRYTVNGTYNTNSIDASNWTVSINMTLTGGVLTSFVENISSINNVITYSCTVNGYDYDIKNKIYK